jgi:hypothetical protein
MSLTQAVARYGGISNGFWGNEAQWCSLLEIPEDIAPALSGWINTATGKPVVHIYSNKDIQPMLLAALRAVVAQGLAGELKTFEGCFMIRDVRGIPGQVSAHAYACAIDLNAATNRLGTPGDMTDALAKCFRDQGFFWGKYFRRQDPMHMSALGW